WDADPKFRIRCAQAATPDGGSQMRFREDDKSSWKTVVTWGPDDADGGVIGFNADGKSLWLRSSEGRDTLSVVKRDLDGGKEDVIAANPKADVSRIIFNPLTHEVEAVAFNRERIQWKAIDPRIEADLKVLEDAGKGEFSIVNRDRDLDTWVVSFESDL